MAPVTLWRELEIATRAACKRFGLRPVRLVASTHPLARYHGQCEHVSDDHSPVIVTIRVHRLGHPKIPLARRTVMDTLVHELAHVAHPDDNGHGPKWRAQYVAIRAFLLAR